jgi:ankyrin repeat protein
VHTPAGKELIVTHPSLPTRRLPARPDLDQLKRQAKDLLRSFTAREHDAVAEVAAYYRGADPATFALHDAQLVLARAYGFESWPKLNAFVDGATVRRLVDAVRARDADAAERLLKARPELARMSIANLGVLHHAVMDNQPAMVRLLMAHGANAREGVYPHRDATSAHAIALQRGYSTIVRIIEEEEQARTRHVPVDAPSLHAAAHAHQVAIVEALIDRGAAVTWRDDRGLTPLDAAAHRWWQTDHAQFLAVARLLLDHGAPLTAAAAAAMGDTGWLRARHEAGALENQVLETGGLLRIAATHDQRDVLQLLLDFGFDPDERMRFTQGDDPAYSWGMALQHCASTRKYEMAELLLARGADPNASIYASGDPMFAAHSENDRRMIELLERYGGVPNATTAGLFRQTDLARRMLSGQARYRLDGVGGDTLAEQLLWGGACGGDPEIVRMALAHVDWPRDDMRWFTILEQPLRSWTHGSVSDGWAPGTYIACFRQVLERADPDLRGRPTDEGQFGLTILHSVAAKDLSADDRVAFAKALLDAGARLDIRDKLLKSTPLGWAARWGRVELVQLLLERGADPDEADAEPWARPRAWAERGAHMEVLRLLPD